MRRVNHLAELLVRSARRFSEKTCVTYEDGDVKLTFGEVNQRANRLANALIGLGVEKGDKVNILSHNNHYYLELYVGLAKCGRVRVPLNARESAEEHTFKINDCEGKALIFTEEFLDLVRGIHAKLEKTEHLICITRDKGKLPEGIIDYESLIAAASDAEPQVELKDGDPFRLSHSGGTTGIPKGVVQSYRTELAFYGNLMLDAFPVKEDDVFLHVHPISHGSGTFVVPSFLRGATQAALGKADAESVMKAIQRERVTMSFFVPTLVVRLVNYPDVKKYDFSSLRWIVYGGAPIAVATLEEAIKTFGNVFCQIWGQVEVPMCATCLPPEDHITEGPEEKVKRLRSCGRETTKCVVKVVDDEGNELPPGEVGELVVRSDHMMEGFLNRPEETEGAFKDGWLHTRDMGYRDEDGYFYLVDRKSEMIISGGFNVYPTEVENVLYTHPLIREAAVVGVPHAEWGETIKAVVVPKEGQSLTEQEVLEYCHDRLAPYKCPKSVDFYAGELPKTSVGKVARKVLRQQYVGGKHE